ncbi:hypothetical protein [Nostoc sphaeroides]|uniref:Uncharacterized protein n=1 Tax=Nostoc sphaeroides CCNUC1 TaxID=2653204 RepID=A0A5P8VS23_9NOSO|nr:hypothetical protein [Nostoc sphaeroides]MCC5628108.1 hypothetical protein [Nostoc sphaeroides CHAB 2801]QFS43243.1 hypothetical protein GXM_00716 [Nostoc sphaeroides CCNUC1]
MTRNKQQFNYLHLTRFDITGDRTKVDVGWVERSATQLMIRMLGYAKPAPNLLLL